MITKDNAVNAKFIDKNTHIIKIKDYYPDDCSGHEYMEVSEELYLFLENERKRAEAEARQERRYIAPFGYDDEATSEINGVVSESVEDEFFSKRDWEQIKKVEDIISKLTPRQRSRLYMRIVKRLSFKEIGKSEGVSITSVEDSYEQSIAKLRKYGYILQNITLNEWLNMLI